MLKNVINLGTAPSCASDLKTAFQTIGLNEQATEHFGFGRAILSGNGKDAESRFSSIIMLRDGALTIRDNNGTEIRLTKGEVANLPAGVFSWDAKSADCIILVLHQDNPQLFPAKLDLEYPMSSGGAPNAALLTTPAPQTARHEFQSEDLLSWGTWATTPYARHPITYSFSELMMLRKGEVTLSNPVEGSATFVAGDIFLVRPGAVAAWDNPSDLEKFWVIRTAD
ncbi:cupin domain-containing protein [Ochrobactrum vermis]|uniref:Cupin domain-containing protein n=1 Tax=Ochrobactrum vermis TaxID=1827297 RepID=A0ABU8PKD3_9HYPH|nr:cupin domain-containing protein [Ochrobactrum vermis]